nr:MAG TPA: Large polyvalent protein associated domain 23 [Caudoviricetes sp.]
MSRKLKDLDSKWGGVRAAAEDDGTETAAASGTGNSVGSVTLEYLDRKWGKPTGREGMSQYETKRTANLNTYVSPERAAAIQKIRDNAAQNKSLLRQTEGQDKAARYAAVNRYFEGDADARRLWKLERGYNANQNAAAARKAEAEALRRGMQPEQREAYNEATKLYDSYGRAYSAGRRAKDVIGGSLKSAADSIGTFMEGMALGGSEESKRAQWEMRQAMDNGTAFTRDENGDLKVSDSYKKALDTYNKTKDDKVVLDEDFSPALARNRADQAQVERGLAGTSGVTRKAGELAGSMAQNAPGMASALIPGVGFGVSMGALGLQAAGSRLDELSARGIDAREALARGAVSGAIEVGTEMVPIGEWVPEKIGKWVKQPVKNWVKIVKEGGESAAENLAKQAMGEATEEGASYVLNYLADLAAKDPEAEFSLAELTDNMAMGAASGAAYGVIGTGINRALGGSAQVNENPPYRAGKNAAEGGVVNQSTIQEENGAQESAQAGSAAQETAKNLSGLQEQAAQLARQALAEQEARRQEQAFTQPLIQQVQQETAQMADRNGAAAEGLPSSAAAAAPSLTGEGTGVLEMIAAQRSMVQNGMTADEAQAAYAARQQRSAGTARVQALADSGIYNEPMREALVKNYQGGSVDTYVQAMNGLYNAGRTGSLSFEQGVRAVAPAAAVVDNESALRAAYDAGRSTVTAGEAMPAPGITNERQSVELRGVRKEDSSAPLEALQLAAMKLGTDFTITDAVQDESGNSANGMYDPASNRITLSEKSVNPYQTALHETAHYIEQYNAEGWAQLKQALLAFYTERVGMTEAQEKVFKAYENAYGTQTDMFDEVAADLLSGIMSTDEGVERYCDYILTADQYTAAEKKTVLETLRQIIDQLISSIKGVLTGGDATLGAAEGRRLAEQAENLTEAASIIDDALDELDIARKNAREAGRGKNVQVEQKAPADSRGGKKYSFAGTEAAQADYNDLHRAQQMELDGEDAEDIRKETGWFRGADYKWRFEIDDSKTVWHREGDYGLMLRDATYREYKDLLNKMLYGTLTDEQAARLQTLSKEYKGAANRGWKTLGDYLEAPELYRQYPDLQTAPVEFTDLGEHTNGAMNRLEGIQLSNRLRGADADSLKRTVLHEVQHWIQNEEGFAGGSNPDYWTKRLQQSDRIETKGMRDARGKMQALEERYPNIAEYADEYGNYEPFTGNSDTVFADRGRALSIETDGDGNEFVNIDEDILDGVDEKDWAHTVVNELKKRFPDGFMRRGWKIELTRDGRKEFTSSKDTKMMRVREPAMYADKMRMAANLDEIVSIADNLRNEAPNHSRKDGIVSFNRSEVNVRVGSSNYTADVVTGIKPDTREIFYNIVNMQEVQKEKAPTEQQSVKRNASLATDVGERTFSNKNIPQSGENVNTPVAEMTVTEAYEESERLKDAANSLRVERKAWENSTAVTDVRAQRDAVRRQYGMFSQQMKDWEANTPAWQEYAAQRDAYKKQAVELSERRDAVDNVLRKAGADEASRRWQENLNKQQAYDKAVQDSGLSVEEYRRELALKQYGTTENFEQAAFLLPNGKMLDFSGGAEGEKRGLDHRNIQTVFGPAEPGQNAAQADYLNQFIREGNVRIMPESPGVDISAETKPTAAQYAQIAEMADTLGVQNRKFSVDLSTADGKQAATRRYEGRVRGSDVVNDIKAYYRDGVMPARSEVEQFRYSKKSAAEQVVSEATEREKLKKQLVETEAEKKELARKYARAAESAEYWRQETQLSGGHLMDKQAVQKTASEFIDKYGSQYGKKQLAGELERAFSKISKDGASAEEALETLTSIAKSVLQESREKDTTLRDYYAPLRDWLRKHPFEVRLNSPEYQDLMNEYGDGADGKRSWANVRKNTFGRVDLRLVGEQVAGNIDTAMMELAEMMPAAFDADAAPADNIRAAMEVFEASKPEYRDSYGNDLNTAAALAGQELMDAYLKTPARETRADKAAATLKATRDSMRAEQKAALATQKADYEMRIKALEGGQSARKAKLRAKWIETTRKAAQTNNAERAARLNRQADGYKKQLMEMDTPDYKKLQKQLLHQRAAYEVLNERRKDTILYDRARDSVQKNVKQLYKWLAKPNDAGHVQTRMERAVYDLLGKIDPSSSARGSKSDVRWQETMKDISQMAQQCLNADKGLTDVDQYADFYPDLPEMIGDLIDDVGDIDLHKMNGRQTQQLADILTSMKTSILNANRMMADGRGQAVQEVAENSIKQMADVKKSQLKTRNALIGKAAGTKVGDMTAQLLGLDMMDARRYFSSLGEASENDVYKPIRDGFDTRVWKLREAQEAFARIKGDSEIRKWTGSRAAKTTFTLESGEKIALTVGQCMEIYNLTQRKQAHEHLIQGGISVMEGGKKLDRVCLTPTDLGRITSSLSNEQVKMARRMAEYLSDANGPAGWGNAVTQKLYGLNKYTESYYWPIKADDNYTRTSDATAGDTPSLYAIKNQGFTKSVQKNANNPLIIHDAFDTWCDHVANVATYSAWAVPLGDAMKWYNYHGENKISTKAAIDGVYGEGGKSFFIKLMLDINGVPSKKSKTGFGRLAKTLVRNWKVAKVGANLRVAIQQPTAYLRAAAVISPKYLTAALGYDVAHLKRGMERAESNCAIAQWKSWGYFETNIGQTMKSVLTGETNTLDKVREISTWGAEMGDKITWGTLWNACELEAQDKGMKAGSDDSIAYCARRLSEIVDKTQVVDSVLHRSHIMRDDDGLAQMATNFFAEPTKTYSMIAEAAEKLAHGEKGAAAHMGRILSTYFVTAFGTAAAASLIDAMRVGGDDKDKDFGERYLEALWDSFVDNCNLINDIPMVKDIKSTFDGFDATRTDMEAIVDMFNALAAWQKYLSGDPKSNVTPYKLLYKTATAFADMTGIPVGTAVREIKSAYDMVTALQDPMHIDETFTDTNAKLNSRLARGQMDEAQETLAVLVQNKIDAGKTEKEARAAIRSGLTSKWKPLYLAAEDAQRAEIASKLLALRVNGQSLYTQKDFDKWVKDSKK